MILTETGVGLLIFFITVETDAENRDLFTKRSFALFYIDIDHYQKKTNEPVLKTVKVR